VLALSLFSLVLFLVAVWDLAPVIVEPVALLGLASYLPVAFWGGLAVLLVVSALVSKSDDLAAPLAIFLLILFALYFQGIAPLVQANARIPNVYWPTSEARYIFETGHLEIHEPVTLAAYRQWPGMHFFTAVLALILGAPLTFVKYAPFVWVFLFLLTNWSIGRRLELPQSHQFLLVAISLASWWDTSTYMEAWLSSTV
jgi:hypothetical protein